MVSMRETASRRFRVAHSSIVALKARLREPFEDRPRRIIHHDVDPVRHLGVFPLVVHSFQVVCN